MRRSFLVLVLALAACGPPPATEPPVAGATEPVSADPSAADAGPDATPEPPAPVPEDRKLTLKRVGFAELPGWQEGKHAGALASFLLSCRRLDRRDDSSNLGRGTILGGKVSQWRTVCRLAKQTRATDNAARAFFTDNFTPYLAANHEDEIGRFTGYYEAGLRGSKKRHGKYQTPLYKRPPDLVMVELNDFFPGSPRRRISGRVIRGKLKPYENRAKIVGGSLAGKGLELVWVDDAIDAFFVQVQGSGVVELDTGGRMRIGYAGQNGHIYTAIGRELIADGHLTKESVSMQSIRQWLLDNPSKAEEMMNRNESYVFFDEVKGGGPIGSQGVVLTPEHSLAIDREFIAQSIPLWIDSVAPVAGENREETWRQLVIAQDTGGAIRGPVRGDIYWGSGERAADIAGRTKSTGRYYLLLPHGVEPPADALRP